MPADTMFRTTRRRRRAVRLGYVEQADVQPPLVAVGEPFEVLRQAVAVAQGAAEVAAGALWR